MNNAATRRILRDQQLRQRIRERVAQARAREAAAASPCQCPACTLLRAIRDAGPGEVEVTVTSDAPSEPPAGVRH